MNDIVQKSEVNPIITFKRNFNKLLDDGEFALPSNVKPEAFKNAALVAVQDDPSILRADQHSLFKSLRRAAASGLVPDGREGALVKFKSWNKETRKSTDIVQFMPMVFGLIKMVRRSGTVTDIRAHIVFQKEVDNGQFDYVVGDQEILTHKPILFGDKGAPVACYAIAKLTDGTIVREFMSAEDIDTVRRAGASQKVYEKGSKPKTSDVPLGIWADWWAEMWKKTVIRRLCKRLDMSADDVRRVMEDQEFDEMRDVTPKADAGGWAKKAMEARAPKEAEEPEQEEESEPEEEAVHDTDTGEIEDAEIVPEFEEDSVDPMTDEYTEGFKASKGGEEESVCPHEPGTFEWNNWLGGYRFYAANADKAGGSE